MLRLGPISEDCNQVWCQLFDLQKRAYQQGLCRSTVKTVKVYPMGLWARHGH
jgi:hypothetical protein